MHRTQIYLPNDLFQSLRSQALIRGISISELIRQALERETQLSPSAAARTYFERLTPLESFSEVTPVEYVRQIRSSSRILRDRSSKRRG